MKAWISGGSGFVGGHLADAFDDVLARVAAHEPAQRTVEAFGLDGDLLDFGPPPPQPCQSRTTPASTRRRPLTRLGVELPGVDEQLRRLERSLACTT